MIPPAKNPSSFSYPVLVFDKFVEKCIHSSKCYMVPDLSPDEKLFQG